MQGNSIDKPGYEGPGFFRIPAPVSAPGRIGPYWTGYDADGQPDKTKYHHIMGDRIDNL